ncbi:hypothetical protein GCM10029976_057360 [Kribbella albertanoniae]|uniref:hypothetical protein n=1 Tax=Kribbella albertanoniae TaxID=1266829 RepID=UPI00140498ED|nr:hypothetical protein [Kribbella albertanoniae]
MNAPEVAGYRFEQLLLEHPLAEVWRGRAFTGMEVVALVLTEAGAQEPVVQERLVQAGREAALAPGQAETPLWAANFSAARPYAITQLVPGQTGAERLVDPLDGIVGNDDASLQAVRSLLSQYGGIAPTAVPSPPEVQGALGGVVDRLGGWVYAVAIVVVLVVFTLVYSVGATVGSAVKEAPDAAPPPVAVSPAALPSTVLLPGLPKITTAPYKRPDGSAGLLGATYPAGADVQVVTKADLPFSLGWPRLPAVSFLGESSTIAYRQIRTDEQSTGRKVPPDLKIALSACANLADCVKDRPAFDEEWTKLFQAPVPSVAKDERTWLTTQDKPYVLTMTRAFQSGGQWWLVGMTVTGRPGEEPDVQRVLNDIWRQTS